MIQSWSSTHCPVVKSLIGKLQISQKEFLTSLLLLPSSYEWTIKVQEDSFENLQHERETNKQKKVGELRRIRDNTKSRGKLTKVINVFKEKQESLKQQQMIYRKETIRTQERAFRNYKYDS